MSPDTLFLLQSVIFHTELLDDSIEEVFYTFQKNFAFFTYLEDSNSIVYAMDEPNSWLGYTLWSLNFDDTPLEAEKIYTHNCQSGCVCMLLTDIRIYNP
jgi:hypothetical protein